MYEQEAILRALVRKGILSLEEVLEESKTVRRELEGKEGPIKGSDTAPAFSLLSTLEEVERQHILRVLAEVNGHRGRAAKILGVDPKTLYRKLQRYGMRTSGFLTIKKKANAIKEPELSVEELMKKLNK